MPAASVIIPARDAASTLRRTLDALGAQEAAESFEVVVVDDGSMDHTAALARAAPIGARVLRGGGGGPAVARNLGVDGSEASVLAFVDADCEPTPGWLAAGLAALAEADLVQGAVTAPPGTSAGPFDRGISVHSETGLYETANLFVKREVFERIGGFESWLRPRRGIELGEDVWFAWRARRAGARTAFSAEALVYHPVTSRPPAAYIAEHARLRFFPAMARRIPELRDAFFYHRYFLSPRSAAFDLAAIGLTVATTRREWLPLAAVIPYGRLLLSDARRFGRRRAPGVAFVRAAADLVAAASLAVGSLRWRSAVL